MNQARYQSHSFYLTESLYPLHPYHNRRQDGGLLLLVSPALKNQCMISYKSRYSLVVTIKPSNKKIAFVYFPPSLDDQTIEYELTMIGQLHLLAGDINIRLGSTSGDVTTSAPSRKSIIYSHISSSSLEYSRNRNGTLCSRTDHLFTSLPNTKWNYIVQLPFASDHGRMEITTNLPLPSSNNLNIGSLRFDFKPLYHEIFSQEFLSRFETLYAPLTLSLCESALKTCCFSMILPDTATCQQIIDETYSEFTNLVLLLLKDTLTTYDAHSVKSKPDNLLSNLTNSPFSTLQTIRSFKRTQRNLSKKSPITSSTANKSPLEECKEHYQNQYNSNNHPPKINRQNDVSFGLSFTNEKIKSTIRNYPLHKSMGPDGIHTIVFNVLSKSDNFILSLSALFQLFAATSLVPDSWNTCNLHLLVKKQDKPRIASNTRPIALSNILRRIFEKTLMNNWMSLSDYETANNNISETAWMQLNQGQAGFRRGFSTISQILLSDELSRRNNPFSIFLDIKGAFDNVNWNKLNQILISRNCPESHRSLILSLTCQPAELLLSVNQSERITISTQKGVFQGGGISAFIFAVYIDPLAEALNKDTPPYRPLGLLFADDVQIKPTDSVEAQKALDICTNYGHEYNMNWSIPKCAIVGECSIPLTLSGHTLQTTSSYKYLGVIHLKNRVDFKSTFETAISKQNSFLTALSNNSWHPKTRLIIYRTFIRPISEYVAAPTLIWAQRDLSTRSNILKLFETTHKSAMKWIFNRQQHLKIMDFLSGLGPYYFRMECLKSSLATSLSNMTSSNPLLAAKNSYLLSTSTHFILPFCFKSTYLTEFQKQKSSNPMKPLTFKTWTVQKLIAESILAAKNSALISYLGPYHPLKMKNYFNLDQKAFADILAWRTNSCFSHCTCICGSIFRRSHVDCVLQSNTTYHEIKDSLAYTESISSISSRSSPHYSVLDFLLNELKFNDFLTLQSALRLSIS
jgi:hypothetical protein